MTLGGTPVNSISGMVETPQNPVASVSTGSTGTDVVSSNESKAKKVFNNNGRIE